MRFLAIILSLVSWIDWILHMMIEQYIFHHSAILPGHEESFKSLKKAFLNDPKCQKWGFWPLSWVWSVGSTWYCILWYDYTLSNIWQHYQVMKDHSKISNMYLWIIQSARKRCFGHILEFGLLDQLDIAYCDSTKSKSSFGKVTKS